MAIRKEYIDKLYFFSFVAVLIFLPWSIRWFNYSLILLCISGLATTNWNEKISQLRQHWASIVFVFLFLLYALGLLYTQNLGEGLKSVEQKMVLAVIPLLAATSVAFTDNQRKQSQLAFVISVGLLTLTCLVLDLATIIQGSQLQVNFDPYTLAKFNSLHPDANPIWMQISYIAFGEPLILSPTLFSIYISLCVVILFHFETHSAMHKHIKYGIIIFFSIIVILLSSRIGVFILFSVGLFNLFKFLVQQKFALRYTASSLGLFIFLCSLIFISPVTRYRLLEEPFSTSFSIQTDPTKWNSFNLRFLEWKSGIEGIQEHGFIGTGTGGSKQVLYKHYSKVDLGFFDNDYGANNQFIEAYLELGILGFVALLLCFTLPFIFSVKKSNMLLLSLIIMTCAGCLSNSLFERARGLTFYISFVSLFMFTHQKDDRERI